MMDQPPALEAILASIRARVMEPDTEEEPEWQPSRPAAPPPSPPPVLLSDVMIPATSAGITLDELMRSMLAPQIKGWLDANMPEIVEKLARDEIKRLTGKL